MGQLLCCMWIRQQDQNNGNRSNILLAVLDSPNLLSTVRDAYVDVLRAVKAGDKIGMIEPMPYGTVNLEYFCFVHEQWLNPELIVGSDCPWEEGDKTYTRKICQLYTCEKTGSGYKSKRMSGYFWDPQMSEKHDYYMRIITGMLNLWILNIDGL